MEEPKTMTNYDVVKKLIGPIEPVGETNTDDRRYENLLQLIELTDQLCQDIFDLCSFANCQEYSRKRAGQKAAEWTEEFRDLF